VGTEGVWIAVGGGYKGRSDGKNTVKDILSLFRPSGLCHLTANPLAQIRRSTVRHSQHFPINVYMNLPTQLMEFL